MFSVLNISLAKNIVKTRLFQEIGLASMSNFPNDEEGTHSQRIIPTSPLSDVV
jgi:hypothetical protein